MSVLSLTQVGIKKRKRIGRGLGSGRGTYAGRGAKGQKARTGGGVRPGFEGGQMPLYRRLPKRGFKSLNHVQYNILNIASLNSLSDGEQVSIEQLKEKGLVKQSSLPVKLLGNGELKIKKLSLTLNACSATAKDKIESLGGKVELI